MIEKLFYVETTISDKRTHFLVLCNPKDSIKLILQKVLGIDINDVRRFELNKENIKNERVLEAIRESLRNFIYRSSLHDRWCLLRTTEADYKKLNLLKDKSIPLFITDGIEDTFVEDIKREVSIHSGFSNIEERFYFKHNSNGTLDFTSLLNILQPKSEICIVLMGADFNDVDDLLLQASVKQVEINIYVFTKNNKLYYISKGYKQLIFNLL